MQDQTLARNEWRKTIAGEEYGETKPLEIIVKAELVKRGGNSLPYFSITGTIKKTDKRYRDPVITCGAIHDEILEHFPELEPLVTVHLSEPDGQPMHAEANARYWAGLCTYADGSPMGEYKPRMLAEHLQADRKTAEEVKKGFEMGLPWERITDTLKLNELWSEQAAAARALLNDVKAGA
jgi:hypothetical protein